jgi:hypothetical protein
LREMVTPAGFEPATLRLGIAGTCGKSQNSN